MPFEEILSKIRLVNTQSLKSKNDLVRLIREMNLKIGEIPENFGFFHGLEKHNLYDMPSQKLFQRQWFTRRSQYAIDYARQTNITFECKTTAPIRVARVPQSEILKSKQFNSFVDEIEERGYRLHMISQWDVPLVRYKRWYLLELIIEATGDAAIRGWIDNPPEELELYLADVKTGFEVTQRRLTGQERPRGNDLGW